MFFFLPCTVIPNGSVRKRKIRKTIRNKWWKLITLVNNPDLVLDRLQKRVDEVKQNKSEGAKVGWLHSVLYMHEILAMHVSKTNCSSPKSQCNIALIYASLLPSKQIFIKYCSELLYKLLVLSNDVSNVHRSYHFFVINNKSSAQSSTYRVLKVWSII